MIKDANIKSAKTAIKFKIPLSTIQGRRVRLENSILKKDYQIDIKQFG